ncbi:MAG TPA: hypothetical protein VGZ73_22455 [Bryobacteraceae bacterium]|jgi:hypothetical protein|nr:hypothetical protein [Bryobacteraceae bacterium]
MELSSPETESPLPASEAVHSPQVAEKPGHPAVPICRTHRCGRCLRCLDEARWERIFREKFADPTYYQERLVKYSSPLA